MEENFSYVFLGKIFFSILNRGKFFLCFTWDVKAKQATKTSNQFFYFNAIIKISFVALKLSHFLHNFKSCYVSSKVSDFKFWPTVGCAKAELTSARRINIVRQTCEAMTIFLWKSHQKVRFSSQIDWLRFDIMDRGTFFPKENIGKIFFYPG